MDTRMRERLRERGGGLSEAEEGGGEERETER